jgi:anthranilate/para-aminobenzoate synthase component I
MLLPSRSGIVVVESLYSAGRASLFRLSHTTEEIQNVRYMVILDFPSGPDCLSLSPVEFRARVGADAHRTRPIKQRIGR